MGVSETSIMLSCSMLPSEYVMTYAKESTRRIHRSAIRKYLGICLGRQVSDIDEAMLEYLRTRDADDVARDLTRYYLRDEIVQLAPMSRVTYLTSIESFFEDSCGFQLSTLQRKLRDRSKKEKNITVIREMAPTREIWQSVLSLLDVRHRAELLISLSGGLRIGEVLQLRLDDVYLDEMPCRIEIRGCTAKNGLSRRTFISQEAVGAVRAYLCVRDSQIERLFSKAHSRELHNLQELFPHQYRNESHYYADAIDAAGYGQRDARTGRRMLHVHSARKWFLTQAKKSAHPDFVEGWAGHSGYLASAYHRPGLEEEREEYLKCELDLTISLPPDYYQVKSSYESELRKMRDAQEADREALASVRQELAELKARTVVPVIKPGVVVIPDFD